MENQVYVGLDYHPSSIQVCVVDGAGRILRNTSVPNTVADVGRAVSGLGPVGAVTIEACCGAADLAEALRREAGWPVELAHAGYVHRMKGNPDKSDYGDARLLAELGRTGFVPRVWLAPRPIRELRALVGYRQQLAHERRAVKVRILALLREQRVRPEEPLRRWTLAWMGWLRREAALSAQARWIVERHLERLETLDEDIQAVEERLAEATADDPVVARLRAQPGIGPVTAWVMRAQIGWFDRFRSGKQLARYCGVSPCNASSGPRQADAGTIRAGDPILKAALVEAGHRLGRLDGRWKGLAAKLRRKGKPGSVVAMAIANRWVRWLYHRMREVSETGVAPPALRPAA